MISVKVPNSSEIPVELPFEGLSPCMGEVSANSLYLQRNKQPWLPVMGEFHFSRYPKQEWERELLKMKAGGIDIAATYVFWIHHEEEKGIWDFTGDRCLRDFIEACKSCELPLILRIGPWAHGECRNGGFPDWLVQDKSIVPRTNDSSYLELVEILYHKIYQQARGLFWEDGGPIVGIQLENEYGHCGGPNDEGGKNHMRKLKEIALNMGFKAPLYTATAWGGAVVVDGETLPVMGAYVDAPWDQDLKELAENPNFLMQTALNDPLIGSDLKRDENNAQFTCRINDYPYLTAELGGGMQPTEHRRVVAFPQDTQALALCKLGSGANLLGYYMYHGGTNPRGRLTTMQESKETGYPNNLPIKSYDFEAPIGEGGETSESYGRLKAIHLFLKEFGHILAPSKTVIPGESSKDPKDLCTPRFSVRHNTEKNCGFVFINNHMRKRSMSEQKGFSLNICGDNLDINLPKINLSRGDMGIFPYNMPLGEAVLESCNAVPLTRIGKRWFFYTDDEPVYNFSSGNVEIITLSQQEAYMAYRFGEKLFIAPCPMFEKESRVFAEIKQETAVVVYAKEGPARTLNLSPAKGKALCSFVNRGEGIYTLKLEYSKAEEHILDLDYLGDKAELYLNKELIADWFTTGLPFRTALKRHGFPKELELKIYPSVPPEERYFDIEVERGCALLGAKLDTVSLCTVETD